MEIVLSQIFDDVKQNSNRSDPGVLTRTKEVNSTFSINKNIRTINKYTVILLWCLHPQSGLRISYREILETRYIETFQSIEEYLVSNLQYPDLFCLFSPKILKFRKFAENSENYEKSLEIPQ